MRRREFLLQLAAARADFLEDLSRRSFQFFVEHADERTGLVRDRAQTSGEPIPGRNAKVASIAATGFGLTALCIGAERGWMSRDDARARVERTLRFFLDTAQREGWFYHFLDMRSGTREWLCEVSSIDTALLLAGVLTARAYFARDRDVVRLSDELYRRVNFQWMLNGHPALLSHGWKPETGWERSRWDEYSEQMILYLLAIGAPMYPIPAASWYAWKRPAFRYPPYRYIKSVAPLFVDQFAHAWIDLRNKREKTGINWFTNSIAATRAHRLFCQRLAARFPKSYSANVWGISASDGPKGYMVWGGPPGSRDIDGTVVPCAPGGSLMFTPDICLPALTTMRDRFGDRIWGRYGFADAFNPTTGWVGRDVIGIDLGITLLSAENLRTGYVWRWYMSNGSVQRAMRAVGLM